MIHSTRALHFRRNFLPCDSISSARPDENNRQLVSSYDADLEYLVLGRVSQKRMRLRAPHTNLEMRLGTMIPPRQVPCRISPYTMPPSRTAVHVVSTVINLRFRIPPRFRGSIVFFTKYGIPGWRTYHTSAKRPHATISLIPRRGPLPLSFALSVYQIIIALYSSSIFP
jgi:hypothetical protein